MKLKLFRCKSCLKANGLFRESQMWTPQKCEHLNLFQKFSFLHPQVCLDWVYNLRCIICKCTCNSLDKNYFVKVISGRLHLSYNCTTLDDIFMSEFNLKIHFLRCFNMYLFFVLHLLTTGICSLWIWRVMLFNLLGHDSTNL